MIEINKNWKFVVVYLEMKFCINSGVKITLIFLQMYDVDTICGFNLKFDYS